MKYQQGDKVIALTLTSGQRVGVIRHVVVGDAYFPYIVLFNNGSLLSFTEDELQPIHDIKYENIII